MSEQQAAPVEVKDPFNGQEPTFAEFSEYREKGEVPARFKTEPDAKAAVTETKPATPAAPAETVEGKEPSPSEQVKESERDEQGKFKAKEKDKDEPLFNAQQQEAFDKAFRKKEAKLRREYDARIEELRATQGNGPRQEPTTPQGPPQRPELPKLSEYKGTVREFEKEVAEYPAKLNAFLEAERQQRDGIASITRRLNESEAKAVKAHADYRDEFDALAKDIQANEEPKLPAHVLKTIAEESEDPHELTYYLAKNREEFRRLATLTPEQTLREVLKLDVKIALASSSAVQTPAPVAKPVPPKPKPPEPVGARASSSAFDVNDEKIDADEWGQQRNKQVAARRRS